MRDAVGDNTEAVVGVDGDGAHLGVRAAPREGAPGNDGHDVTGERVRQTATQRPATLSVHERRYRTAPVVDAACSQRGEFVGVCAGDLDLIGT